MEQDLFKDIWNEAYNQIREEYKNNNREEEFLLWFNMTYVSCENNLITVSVASDFMGSRMKTIGNFSILENKIKELCGNQFNITINYIVTNQKISNEPITEENSLSSQNKEFIKEETKSENIKSEENINVEIQKKTKHPLLEERFTFETFIKGENSEFAYSMAMAAAKEPGMKYSPLLIYGGVGLGKTHLMQSIGNYIYKNSDKDLKIHFISTENLLNEFTKALRTQQMESFKKIYRNLDVLLLDDIHFLIGKEGLQEELFYTFEALNQRHAQMVFTCDRPLSQLKGIEERLHSRFSRGTPMDLQPPNYETRKAIIQKKLELENKYMPNDVIDYIAKNVQSNVRDLESCIITMISYSELLNKPLTVEIAHQRLKDTISQSNTDDISVETIKKIVADHYNIDVKELTSKSRKSKLVTPRFVAIYITRELTEYSFPEIANEFGGRDHSTIQHAYNKTTEDIKFDAKLNSTIQSLIQEIKESRRN